MKIAFLSLFFFKKKKKSPPCLQSHVVVQKLQTFHIIFQMMFGIYLSLNQFKFVMYKAH